MDSSTRVGTQQIPQVSEKNTKKEIINAYAELVAHYKKEVAETPDKKKEDAHKQEQTTLMEVSKRQNESGDIASSIHQVRTAVTSALEDIQSKLEKEFEQFSTLEQAVKIQRARLKELYEIEEASDNLLAIIRARHDQEEQIRHEKSDRDQQKAREEEHYQYELNKKRRQDEDNRQLARKTFEEELAIKKEELALQEKAWKEKQQEYIALTEQVDAFPERLEAEKERVRTATEASVTHDKDTMLVIAQKEFETQKAVLESRVEGLNTTIQDQRQNIGTLQQQLQNALNQIQEMTLKSMEVRSDSRALHAVNKIAMEQASGGRSSNSSRPQQQ